MSYFFSGKALNKKGVQSEIFSSNILSFEENHYFGNVFRQKNKRNNTINLLKQPTLVISPSRDNFNYEKRKKQFSWNGSEDFFITVLNDSSCLSRKKFNDFHNKTNKISPSKLRKESSTCVSPSKLSYSQLKFETPEKKIGKSQNNYSLKQALLQNQRNSASKTQSPTHQKQIYLPLTKSKKQINFAQQQQESKKKNYELIQKMKNNKDHLENIINHLKQYQSQNPLVSQIQNEYKNLYSSRRSVHQLIKKQSTCEPQHRNSTQRLTISQSISLLKSQNSRELQLLSKNKPEEAESLQQKQDQFKNISGIKELINCIKELIETLIQSYHNPVKAYETVLRQMRFHEKQQNFRINLNTEEIVNQFVNNEYVSLDKVVKDFSFIKNLLEKLTLKKVCQEIFAEKDALQEMQDQLDSKANNFINNQFKSNLEKNAYQLLCQKSGSHQFKNYWVIQNFENKYGECPLVTKKTRLLCEVFEKKEIQDLENVNYFNI